MKDFQQQTTFERNNLRLESQLKVVSHQKDFDLIHLHSQAYAYAVAKLLITPCALTIHNKIDPREFKQLQSANIQTVMLFADHKNKLKTAAVITNGIAIKEIPFSSEKEDYLITIGRLTEPKGIDVAIKIAKKAKKKLLIFGRIGNSPKRQAYFNEKIKPHLNSQIVYMGEASQQDIFKYLKNAEALLFPIKPRKNDYLSVVPLVAMESLACGTPIIGVPINLLPKQLCASDVSCLSNDINVLTNAAKTTEKFDRLKCRQLAEKYFDSSVMAEKYLKLYEKMLKLK